MVKARRVVKDLLHLYERRKLVLEGLHALVDVSYPPWLRVLWFIILVTSLIFCSYQTYNRASYFMSGPIAVDVRIVEVARFPSFTMCSQDTQDLIDYKRNNAFGSGLLSKFTCMNQLLEVINKGKNITADKLWSLTNTSKVISKAVLKRLDEITPITPINLATPMGLCSTFQLNAQMKHPTTTQFILRILKPPGGCESSIISGTAAEPGQESIDTRNVFGFVPRQLYQVYLSYKQYKFLNSNKQPCSDHNTYDYCSLKCILQEYRKEEFPCRFPFMPLELNLESCQLENPMTKKLYTKAFRIFLNSNPIGSNCSCNRRCQKIVFEIGLSNTDINQDFTMFVISLTHKHVTSVEERYAYDFIALLGDFGGNLGLYFGLSTFTAVYYVVALIEYLSAARDVKHREDRFPDAVKLVRRVFIQHMKKQENKKLIRKNSKSKLHLLVFIVLLITGSYLLYIRISYFLSLPTRVVMDVLENSTITFPSMTVCADNKKCSKFRKSMYKSYAKRNNITIKSLWQFCELDFWSLFDQTISAEELWKFKNLDDLLESNMGSFGTDNIGLTTVKEKNITLIDTPTGRCVHFEIGTHEYIGTGTVFAFISKQKQCEPNATIYVTAPDEEPNLYSQVQIVLGGLSGVYLTVKEVSDLRTYKNLCTSREVATQCQSKCLEKFLNLQLECRLPYMRDVDRPMCSSSKSAKEAQASYTRIFLTKDCNCSKPCRTTIYEPNWFLDPRDNDYITLVGAIFIHNTIEHVKEIASYSFIHLLCDIGAIMGLTLGLCLPEIFHTIQNVIIYICNKITN